MHRAINGTDKVYSTGDTIMYFSNFHFQKAAQGLEQCELNDIVIVENCLISPEEESESIVAFYIMSKINYN